MGLGVFLGRDWRVVLEAMEKEKPIRGYSLKMGDGTTMAQPR